LRTRSRRKCAEKRRGDARLSRATFEYEQKWTQQGTSSLQLAAKENDQPSPNQKRTGGRKWVRAKKAEGEREKKKRRRKEEIAVVGALRLFTSFKELVSFFWYRG